MPKLSKEDTLIRKKTNTMKADVLLGLQWGDEGKGKIVDVLTSRYDIIARFQGGPNAGHTLEFNGIKGGTSTAMKILSWIMVILIFFISVSKITGSITTPLPIKLITPLWNIPEGIVCNTCLIPLNSRVCPAFGPP